MTEPDNKPDNKDDNVKFVRATVRLNKLTQERKLVWTKISDVYMANYMGDVYSVTKEPLSPKSRERWRFNTPNDVPLYRYVLNLLSNGEIAFTFPKADATKDLYEAVEKQVNDVDAIVNSALDKLFKNE